MDCGDQIHAAIGGGKTPSRRLSKVRRTSRRVRIAAASTIHQGAKAGEPLPEREAFADVGGNDVMGTHLPDELRLLERFLR
jgi:hypothetical protein